MKNVNKAFRKKDAMQLVTGKPVYMDDLAPADCLIVTRSPWQRRSGTCQVELLSFGEQRRRHRVRGLPYEPVAFLRDRLAGK